MTQFRETWTETAIHVHADLAETEIIRYMNHRGQTVWVKHLELIIISPTGEIQKLVIDGQTENGKSVSDNWLEG